MTDTTLARCRVLLHVLLAVSVVTAFLPAFDIFIAGDDFEWLDASYDIIADPLSSLGLINHFFRPLVKWTYIGDYLIFGQIGSGYMATNLLVHFLNSLLFYALLERRLKQPGAAAAAAAFALSPLHSEAVLWAAGRPDTVLLACWLGALLLLDRWVERPTACGAAAFTGVALLGIGAKESWIVFPFLVVAYLVLVLGLPLRFAFRRVALLWMALFVYIVVFLVVPLITGAQSATHYADFIFIPALIKTSATALEFCGLGWVQFGGWAAVALSISIVSGTAAWLIRTHNGLGQWALLWLMATLALVAPFPMAVLRHNYLPLAGFWMLVAAIVDRSLSSTLSDATGSRRRRLAVGLVTGATIVVLAIEGWAMQREIADYRFYGDFHRQLCESFAAIEPKISRDRPLVFVDRGTFRGIEVVADAVQGCDKTFFVRRDAIWQLVFLPPLVNFVGRPFDERLERVEMENDSGVPDAFTVLLFEDSGFSLRPDLRDAVAKAVDAPGGIPPGVGLYRFIAR